MYDQNAIKERERKREGRKGGNRKEIGEEEEEERGRRRRRRVYCTCTCILKYYFFFSTGEGMKALRAHNIVHRDIKPGNILIKYHPKTGKMMVIIIIIIIIIIIMYIYLSSLSLSVYYVC